MRKKDEKNIRIPMKKFKWDNQHSLVFDDIKKAVASIAQIN